MSNRKRKYGLIAAILIAGLLLTLSVIKATAADKSAEVARESATQPAAQSGEKWGQEVQRGSRYLAFQSNRTRRSPRNPGRSARAWQYHLLDVFIIDLRRRSPVLVSHEEPSSGLLFRPSSPRWSPNRKWLAWPGEYALFVSDVTGKSQAVYRPEAPKRRRARGIASPWGFAWGPSSKRLAVWKMDDGQTVICRLDGTVEKKVEGIAGAEGLVDLDWSRDGKLAQVFGERNGTCTLYLLNPDSTTWDRREILSFKGGLLAVRFSPNSKELVFVGRTKRGSSIYTVSVDGKCPTERVQDLAGRDPHVPHRRGLIGTQPRWSLDSQRLTYANNGHIYVINRDGSGLKDLTPPGMIAGCAVWSPDGKQIAFHAGRRFGNPRSPRWDIWLIDADGKNLKQLTKHRADDMFPEWAP